MLFVVRKLNTAEATKACMLTLRFILLHVLLLLLLSACAADQVLSPATPLPASPSATPSPVPAATATPPAVAALEQGFAIDIGDRALFLRCTPEVAGAPTVLLESGLGADHTVWEQVQTNAAQYARVCSYDRAGRGQSDPAPAPRDADAVAADLHALLGAAGVGGPYILVGHSFGGLFARQFAAAHRDDIVGLVLVDAVHEQYWSRALATLPPAEPGDSERLQRFRQYLTSDLGDPARNAEGIDIPAVVEQLRTAGDLGTKPVIVLVAGVPDVLAPGLPPAVEKRLVALLQQELPAELAALSSDSTTVVVPDSGHNIPQQRPAMVVLAIQAVLAASGQ